MKNIFIFILSLLLSSAAISDASLTEEKLLPKAPSYFPPNDAVTLIYNSSFGECETKYFKAGEYTISSSEADDFKYRQALIIKNDGVYVMETYQYIKIFLFINKEATATYGKPLLRFPLPLLSGKEWEWEGDEYSDGEMNKVKVTGKVIGNELVSTDAGVFEAIKIESLVVGSSDLKNRVTEWYVEDIGLIKAKIIIEGGGLMGFVRDLMGYGTIEFELKEIRKQ